jgi:two-component system response regulator
MNRPLLLVEDDPTDQKLTLHALLKSGVADDVVVVRDGAEALDYMFATGMYDGRDPSILPAMILLDLKLPRIDGLDVLRKIRAEERMKRVPIVILTASKEHDDITRGYALGANAYVCKPVSFLEFVEAAKMLGHFWLLLNEPPPPERADYIERAASAFGRFSN